ncbi:hypothetical protein M514_03445 [Trichuris suis]|uniref:Uncharacterized protein n=1 Tax=Trichuris suis TaxID=68888 RepID=A0A085NF63_9BILA|nr:hypothetical protein M514_03445 [Trichuris suis]
MHNARPNVAMLVGNATFSKAQPFTMWLPCRNLVEADSKHNIIVRYRFLRAWNPTPSPLTIFKCMILYFLLCLTMTSEYFYTALAIRWYLSCACTMGRYIASLVKECHAIRQEDRLYSCAGA